MKINGKIISEPKLNKTLKELAINVENVINKYYGNIAESYVSHLVKSKINKHYSIWSVNVAAMKILQNVENCGICVEIL